MAKSCRMTRITSGLLKGKLLQVPRGIRPLTEKVRKAIFDSLGDWTQDTRVLDLFAGSGAAGIEALSHGAGSATFVDKLPTAILAIKDNTKDLDSTRIKIIKQDAASFESLSPFDLIIADPPYKEMAGFSFERVPGMLAAQGFFILSHASRDSSPEILGLTLIKRSVYGDTALSYYQKTV